MKLLCFRIMYMNFRFICLFVFVITFCSMNKIGHVVILCFVELCLFLLRFAIVLRLLHFVISYSMLYVVLFE